MKEKISIIVPVYNVEMYLEKCLTSILNQTYSNIEILLIDDGSTDNSPKICDECKKKDNRIVVIHKKNEGVSKARNFGIDKSTGDYILFIDSDDFIAPNYVETLYENLIKYDADISMCNIVRINQDGDLIDEFDISRKSNKSEIKIMNRTEFISNILDYKYYYTYATNKLIKKDIVDSIRFRDDIHYNEDGIFFFDISKNIKKAVFVCPVYLYYYVQNGTNANSKKFNDKYLSIIKSFEIMEDYFNEFNYNNKCIYSYKYLNYLIEANYYLYMKKRIKRIKNDEFRKVYKKYFNYAIKSDISLTRKIEFRFKVFLPRIFMKLKNIKSR